MPLLTGLAGKPANVRPEFYQIVTMPLALVMLLLMAAAPVLRWSKQTGTSWLQTFGIGGVAGLLTFAATFAAGMRDPLWLSLLAATGWMLGLNAWVSFKLFRRGWAYGAGYLGHAGVAVMALGIAVSGGFGKTERVQLTQGEPRESLGYRLTYTGMKDEGRRGQAADIKVERGSWSMNARPRMMESPRGDGMMHTPAIDLLHDIYVSPVEMGGGTQQHEGHSHAEPVWLTKNEATTTGTVSYVFRGFRMEHTGQQYLAYADVDVTVGGQTTRVSPGLKASAAGSEPFGAEVPGLGMLTLARMDADRGRIAVMLPESPEAAAVVTIDMSTKPLVNLVWVGALLMLIGTAIAGVRRAREQTVKEPRRAPVRAAGVPAEVTPKPVV
jgi:cytochrome c-type biogenesis protein CcmF